MIYTSPTCQYTRERERDQLDDSSSFFLFLLFRHPSFDSHKSHWLSGRSLASLNFFLSFSPLLSSPCPISHKRNILRTASPRRQQHSFVFFFFLFWFLCVYVIIVTEYNRRRDPGWWPTTSRVVTQTRGQPTSSGHRRSVRFPVCCFFFAITTRHPPPFHLLCILDKKHFI